MPAKTQRGQGKDHATFGWEVVTLLTDRHAFLQVSLANPKYMPHLSLLYSGISEEEKREARLEARRKLGNESSEGSIRRLSVGSFELYETPMVAGNNSTKSWKRVAQFNFRNFRRQRS